MKQTLLLLLFHSVVHAQQAPSAIHYADSITVNDTLVITAFIPDLGEWGGHTEYIYLFRHKNGVLMYRHQVKDTCCLPSLKIDNEPDRNYFGICTRNATDHLRIFLAALHHYDLKKEKAYNAFYFFELRFRNKLLGKWQAYFPWKEYEKMRKQVISR